MNSAAVAIAAMMAVSSGLIQAQSSTPQVSSAAGPAQPYVIQFPRDLYDHPAFQTEWWYFTGNPEARSERRYGFELTFFRSYAPTGAPAGQPQFIPIIFADLAVSDLHGQQFHFHKTLAPEGTPAANPERARLIGSQAVAARNHEIGSLERNEDAGTAHIGYRSARFHPAQHVPTCAVLVFE